MEPFNNHLPNPSVSVMGPLGGAIMLVNRTSKPRLNDQSIPRDSDGYSPALRMAWYSLKMIQSTDILDFATIEHQVIIAWNIALVAQFTTQNLSISGSNPLWDSLDGSVESEIVDFSAELQLLLVSWMRIEQLPGSAIVNPLLERLLETSQGVTAMSYHSGCAYSFLASEYYNTHSKSDGSEWTEKFGFVHETRNTIRSAALLTSAPESKSLMKFCNELLVNLTVYDFQDKDEEGI